MAHTLINAALKVEKKPSKELAREYIRSLYDQHPEAEYELAQLYSYFMPTAPAKAKAKANTDFQWVARSCAAPDIRTGIKYVWVDGEGYMVATNGHSLHMAPSSLARGYYHPATGEPCSCDFHYPAWERVVPETPSKDFAAFRLIMADTTVEELELQYGGMQQILRVPTDYGVQGFDRQYILAALNGRTESSGYISTSSKQPRMVLVDGKRTAVVMGMR